MDTVPVSTVGAGGVGANPPPPPIPPMPPVDPNPGTTPAADSGNHEPFPWEVNNSNNTSQGSTIPTDTTGSRPPAPPSPLEAPPLSPPANDSPLGTTNSSSLPDLNQSSTNESSLTGTPTEVSPPIAPLQTPPSFNTPPPTPVENDWTVPTQPTGVPNPVEPINSTASLPADQSLTANITSNQPSPIGANPPATPQPNFSDLPPAFPSNPEPIAPPLGGTPTSDEPKDLPLGGPDLATPAPSSSPVGQDQALSSAPADQSSPNILAGTVPPPPAMGVSAEEPKKGGWFKWFVIIVIILAVVGGVLYFLGNQYLGGRTNSNLQSGTGSLDTNSSLNESVTGTDQTTTGTNTNTGLLPNQ